jgi:hypothetical protein
VFSLLNISFNLLALPIRLLESFDLDKLNTKDQQKSLNIKYEEDFIIKKPQNAFDRLKKYLIEVGIYNIYENSKAIITIEHVLKIIGEINEYFV